MLVQKRRHSAVGEFRKNHWAGAKEDFESEFASQFDEDDEVFSLIGETGEIELAVAGADGYLRLSPVTHGVAPPQGLFLHLYAGELARAPDGGWLVLAGASVLLARLVAWARARQARVGSFTLRMGHERQRQAQVPATELHVELAEPALDAAHLQLLLRERLGRCQLAAPTLELQLRCHHLVASPAPNGELFPTRASEAVGLVRLLERLRARLGDEQVQRLEPVADHRPERASRSVPVQGTAQGRTQGTAQGTVPVRPGAALAAASAAASAPAVPALPHHRPAWLLPLKRAPGVNGSRTNAARLIEPRLQLS